MDGIKKKLIIKYKGMLARCYNPKEKCYHNYGGRGITICDEWLNGKDGKSGFECFYEWSINNGYQENLSIDRINNDLGYSLVIANIRILKLKLTTQDKILM